MSLEFMEAIKQAIDMINDEYDWKPGFSDCCPVWYFTTENLNHLFNNFIFDKKEVLTICSSGDHAINAILDGANHVDCFDINILTKYYMFLKIGAIKSLDYNEFKHIFLNFNLNSINYRKIYKSLTPEIQEFWNIIFSRYKWKDILKTSLFIKQFGEKNITNNNSYLNEEVYYYVREKLNNDNINFIHSTLIDLPDNTIKKYDLIFLSNLNNHIQTIFGEDYLVKYKEFITNNLSNIVNENGEIALGYLYALQGHEDFIECFSDISRVISFPYCQKASYSEKMSLTDRAVIYKKTN